MRLRKKKKDVIRLTDSDLTTPSLFSERTLVIKTWGPGAIRATHANIVRLVAAIAGVAPTTLQVWRLEDPKRWYTVGPPNLHGKQGELAKIVSSSLGVERFEKVPRKPDQIAAFVPKSREKAIPHFINIKFRDEDTFSLLIVPGRRTECRHCSDTDHWSNNCPTKKTTNAKYTTKQKTRRAADELKLPKSATYEAVKKGPAAVEPERESEAAADDEMEDSQSGWQTVPPRRKRRRQGPTPPREGVKSPDDSFHQRLSPFIRRGRHADRDGRTETDHRRRTQDKHGCLGDKRPPIRKGRQRRRPGQHRRGQTKLLSFSTFILP
ncbi:hypothetical protein RRG08_014438 [Elysia crispata]|uniref:CCHC-type domain-containing protein n=1 Tax=Elysia crispata TaxID=231223 RepID=A0AAE0YV79_9GAST|nr:hypothetical protein RRG08_014438 [Elysia crispata]